VCRHQRRGRRRLILGVAAVLLAGMSGCSSCGKPDAPNPTESTQQGTLPTPKKPVNITDKRPYQILNLEAGADGGAN